jgi:hypothetical protein
MTERNERADDLRRVVQRLARRRAGAGAPDGAMPLWDAAYFGLDRIARFQSTDVHSQQGVLDACARALLAESWRIERCGIEYCARMTLAAEGDDERAMFALIGADEALHASWLAPWIEKAVPDPDPFSGYVAGLAEAGNPQPLAYLLQVVLEGFGIGHYGTLSAHCRDAGLAATFANMQQDEALHHAGGLAAFRPDRLTASDRRFLEDATYAFLQMIRCGPQSVVAALDRSIGLSNPGDTIDVFSALDAQAVSAQTLARLRRLMLQPGMEWLIEALDNGGVFEPCSAADCAQIYLSSR